MEYADDMLRHLGRSVQSVIDTGYVGHFAVHRAPQGHKEVLRAAPSCNVSSERS